jgi:hypothetical protein
MTQRKSFPLRLDPALYKALEGWAAQELRSVNGQIEFLLKQSVLARDRKARVEESRDAASKEQRGTSAEPPLS